jgi:hypothetical protein
MGHDLGLGGGGHEATCGDRDRKNKPVHGAPLKLPAQ